MAVYQDDGFTGLNMERPDLQRMLRAIERRQINLVITKDLSRLGRNYLQTGHLIEDFFPRNGVRYIAMNDGIDTLRDNNDMRRPCAAGRHGRKNNRNREQASRTIPTMRRKVYDGNDSNSDG